MVQWMHFIVSIFLNLSIVLPTFLPFDLFRYIYIYYLIPLDQRSIECVRLCCCDVVSRSCLPPLLWIRFLWIYEMTLHKQSSSLLYRKMLYLSWRIYFSFLFFRFFYFVVFCSLYSELFLFRIVRQFIYVHLAWTCLGIVFGYTWACAHGSVLTVSGGPRTTQHQNQLHFDLI